MTTNFLLLVALSLFLYLKGAIIYGLEFKNLNATVTIDSGLSVGELVFTLKTSDDRRQWAISLDTKSKYFELNPADRRRIVVKACLPAGLTEVLEFSLDRLSNDDNGKLTVNVVPVAPIYNIPSEILVPVGSQSLIVDVLLIKFANAGECTSFRCEVVSRNEDKKFWIEDGTSLIRTYLRDLKYNFKYELEVRCLDSGVSNIAPASDDKVITVSVAFTDDPDAKSKAAPAFYTNTTTKPDTLFFGEKPDVYLVNENNDPYGFSAEDAEVAMLSGGGLDYGNVNHDNDEISLKRYKRSGVSTASPAVASNATYTAIRVKPRCFCSSNFPRPGPNGFMIRKYNPVRVAPVVAMTTVPPTISTTTPDAATTDVETSTIMTSTEMTTSTTMTTTEMTSTTTTPSTTDFTTTSTTSSTTDTTTTSTTPSTTDTKTTSTTPSTTDTTTTSTTSSTTDTTTTSTTPSTTETTTTSTTSSTADSTITSTTSFTTDSTTTSTTSSTTDTTTTTTTPSTTDSTTTSTTPSTTDTTTTSTTTSTTDSTTTSTTIKSTTAATTKLTTTEMTTTSEATTTTPKVTTIQTTDKITTSVPSTSWTTTSIQGTTTLTAASTTSTAKTSTATTDSVANAFIASETTSSNVVTTPVVTMLTTGADRTTFEATTTASTSETPTTTLSVPSIKVTTSQSATSTTTRQDTTSKITTTIKTNTGTDTSTTAADSMSMEMTSSVSGSVSGSDGSTQSIASQATTSAAPAPTNTGAQVGETTTPGFFDQMQNLLAVAGGGVAGLAGLGFLIYKFGMVNKCRHSASVGSDPSGTTDLSGLSATSVNPISSSPTAPLATNTEQNGITPVGS